MEREKNQDVYVYKVVRIPSPGPPSSSALCTYRKPFKGVSSWQRSISTPTTCFTPTPASLTSPGPHAIKWPAFPAASAQSEAHYKALTGCLIMAWKWDGRKGRGADSSQGKIHTVKENNVLFVSHGSKATKKAKQDQNNFPHHLLLSCGAKSLGTYTRKMLTQEATKPPPFETGQGSLPFTPKFKILCKPCTWYQPHRWII